MTRARSPAATTATDAASASSVAPYDRPETAPGGGVAARIAAVAADLRQHLTPLIEALAGVPPRPVRLVRRIGLDKSLASRLVHATRAQTGAQFLHAAPSPTGLRILLERSSTEADPALLQAAAAAIDRFEALLDGLPGGRQALDAVLGANSATILRKREQVARQASFKAVSFLFGHYCDTLTTTLVIVPSASAGCVDYLEVHRRLGLQRLNAAPVPMLSMLLARSPQGAQATGGGPCVADLSGDTTTRRQQDFLIASASSAPLPTLRVVDEGDMTVFLLDEAPANQAPQRLTSALRVLRAHPAVPSQEFAVPRRYMLTTPCSTLVRDVYLAEGLWPTAQLHVGFYLPGPTGSPDVTLEPGRPHHRQLHLTCRIEQLPTGPTGPTGLIGHDLDAVPDQAQTLHDALARAGLDGVRLRGWRCTMAYPVPLVEMQIGFRFSP